MNSSLHRHSSKSRSSALSNPAITLRPSLTSINSLTVSLLSCCCTAVSVLLCWPWWWCRSRIRPCAVRRPCGCRGTGRRSRSHHFSSLPSPLYRHDGETPTSTSCLHWVICRRHVNSQFMKPFIGQSMCTIASKNIFGCRPSSFRLYVLWYTTL